MLIGNCLNYINKGDRPGNDVYQVGVKDLFNNFNFLSQSGYSDPEKEIWPTPEDQKTIYDFFKDIAVVQNTSKTGQFLFDNKRAYLTDRILNENSNLVMDTLVLLSSFNTVQAVVTKSTQNILTQKSKHKIEPLENQRRKIKLKNINQEISGIYHVATEMLRQAVLRGPMISSEAIAAERLHDSAEDFLKATKRL